jgi:hypothetical protein
MGGGLVYEINAGALATLHENSIYEHRASPHVVQLLN